MVTWKHTSQSPLTKSQALYTQPTMNWILVDILCWTVSIPALVSMPILSLSPPTSPTVSALNLSFYTCPLDVHSLSCLALTSTCSPKLPLPQLSPSVAHYSISPSLLSILCQFINVTFLCICSPAALLLLTLTLFPLFLIFPAWFPYTCDWTFCLFWPVWLPACFFLKTCLSFFLDFKAFLSLGVCCCVLLPSCTHTCDTKQQTSHLK